MRKCEEIANPKSCLNRARDLEMVFVLLGRDAATPAAIREWVRKRIELGKNKVTDDQILEALSVANAIEEQLP